MKINSFEYNKSRYLAMEKDLSLIMRRILKNDDLKKLLYYTSKDCMSKPILDSKQTESLINNQIKLVPKLLVEPEAKIYMLITFDTFATNETNPEFRDSILTFDIFSLYDLWTLEDFQLRPYRIAAELDDMFDRKHLSGIGQTEFLTSNLFLLNDVIGGLSVMYKVINGEEDKVDPL